MNQKDIKELALRVLQERFGGAPIDICYVEEHIDFAQRFLAAYLAEQKPVATVVMYQGNRLGALDCWLEEGTKLFTTPPLPESSKSHVGASPLPEEVWKMVKGLRHHYDPHYCIMLEAADMLERLAAPIPDGMVLAPKELTDAGNDKLIELHGHLPYGWKKAYRLILAMIAAGEKK